MPPPRHSPKSVPDPGPFPGRGRAAATPLAELAGLLRMEGGLVAGAVRDPPAGADESLGALVSGRGPQYAMLVEAIREGHLLHYGEGRVVRPGDPDLALLAGDRLYALGLARLAELGDLAAVTVLADVIARCARCHAEGRGGEAEAAWQAGAREIAAGA